MCSSTAASVPPSTVSSRAPSLAPSTAALSSYGLELADVVRALERTTEVIDCAEPPCVLRGRCSLKGLLDEANAAARELGRGTVGNNVMYLETGQGSALSSGTHLGTDGVAVRRQALRRPDRSDLDLAAHPGSMQRLHRRAEISRLVRSSRRGHRSTVGLG